MSVTAGSRLGPFEIVAPIGAGGMGEVFKARDTRLGRTVAIKVLPAEFARDRERSARLRREASIISQLNHPHICTLYDVGSEDGIEYLVMEYLDGNSLADRLLKGPLPLGEALEAGADIAEALHRAHKDGIIHRDLKPSNIMLTKSGVKLLDFGLARSAEPQMSITADGAVFGTVQYMAPEQLEGKPADERSDIYALGAVLHEMMTSKRAFEGLRPTADADVDHIIRKCLEKNPDDRWQSAADVAEQLRWLRARPRPAETKRPAIGWKIAAGVLLLALAAALIVPRLWKEEQERSRLHLVVTAPQGWFIGSPTQRPFVVSPDGKNIALMSQRIGWGVGVGLWVHDLSQTTPRMIEGTTSARHPFWSADSRFIAFFADSRLKKAPIAGGAPETICVASPEYGATWGSSGTIVYASRTGVHRVQAEGGTPTTIIAAEPRRIYLDPFFLPDGVRYLITRYEVDDRSGTIVVRSLRDNSERAVLRNATNASWIASGHLLFVRGVMLMAQRFDLDRGDISGDAVTVAPSVGVLRAESMNALYSASRDGRILALQPSLSQDVRLVHIKLDGDLIAELAGPGRIWFPSVTADGRRLACDIAPAAGDADIWTMDLTRRVMMRLTSEPSNDKTPIWSPDSKWIVYSSDLGLFRIPSDGGTRELLVRTPFSTVPTDWSRDGEYIVFTEYDEPGGPNIKALRMSDRKVVPILVTQFREHWGRLSPDGQWLAYNSNESGQSEVYVQRLKDGAFKTRISDSGGSEPSWLAGGKRVHYSPMRVVDIQLGNNGIQVSKPSPLNRRPVDLNPYSYTVLPDGQTVIGRRRDEASQSSQIEILVDALNNLP